MLGTQTNSMYIVAESRLLHTMSLKGAFSQNNGTHHKNTTESMQNTSIYGSVSPGRNFAQIYVLFFLSFETCCDQTKRAILVLPTVSERSFYLDY